MSNFCKVPKYRMYNIVMPYARNFDNLNTYITHITGMKTLSFETG